MAPNFIIISLIYLLVPAIFLFATVLAFRAQRNWATITMLASICIIFLIIAYTMFSLYTMFSSRGPGFTEPSALDSIIETLFHISPITFIIGLVGFMRTSKKIYRQQDELGYEKIQLTKKLNALNQSQP